MGEDRNMGLWDIIRDNRDFIKCIYPKAEIKSDQQKKLPQPPLCKAAGTGEKITITGGFDGLLKREGYRELLTARRSCRAFDGAPITKRELAFILWSSQSVQYIRGDNYATMRPVPSGGARHAFETYFFVGAGGVEGLKTGFYHYLPLENVGSEDVTIEYLGGERSDDEAKKTITDLLVGQNWAEDAAVTFLYTCVAYRAEWRYAVLAHRPVLIDLGHLGQNVSLSVTALGLAACCSAAYDVVECDKALGVDGSEEYTVYAVVVGREKVNG